MNPDGQKGTLGVAVALCGPIILGAIFYAEAAAGPFLGILGVSLGIGAGIFGLGALLGFLFGVPKLQIAGDDAKSADRGFAYLPNTNLEQVSDWLTKIIIGVGLVQLDELVHSIGEFADTISPALGGDGAQPYAIALILSSFVAGFLIGYIFTRLQLQGRFSMADSGAFMRFFEEKEAKDLKATTLVKEQLDPGATSPRTDELQESIKDASPTVQQQIAILAEQEVRQGDSQSQQAAAPILEVLEEDK